MLKKRPEFVNTLLGARGSYASDGALRRALSGKSCFVIAMDMSRLSYDSGDFGLEFSDLFLGEMVGWFARQSFGDAILLRLDSHQLCLVLQNATFAAARKAAVLIENRFSRGWRAVKNDFSVSYQCSLFLTILRTDGDEKGNLREFLLACLKRAMGCDCLYFTQVKPAVKVLEHEMQ